MRNLQRIAVMQGGLLHVQAREGTPGAAHGVHALEVAMDELSYALKMDPLALRLKNYTERDAAKDLPYSSKELRACYEQGAARFGWSVRYRAVGSLA